MCGCACVRVANCELHVLADISCGCRAESFVSRDALFHFLGAAFSGAPTCLSSIYHPPSHCCGVGVWCACGRVDLLEQKSKFVANVLDGSLKLNRVSRKDLEKDLVAKGFAPRGGSPTTGVQVGVSCLLFLPPSLPPPSSHLPPSLFTHPHSLPPSFSNPHSLPTCPLDYRCQMVLCLLSTVLSASCFATRVTGACCTRVLCAAGDL